MSGLYWLVTIAALALPASAGEPARPPEPKERDRVRLVQGIVGGIVAPVPRLVIEIEADGDGAWVRLDEPAAGAERGGLASRRGEMTAAELADLLEALEPLWKLPVEDPRASEDIYGLDTSIELRRGARHWVNAAPGGCLRGTSRTRPSPAERAAFARLVERIVTAARARVVPR